MIQRLVSYLGAAYLYLVGKTSFVHAADDPEYLIFRRQRKPVIYAFWHNNQVFLAYAHRREKIHIMVSQSSDGEYIAQVMKRLGLVPVRGSSSRGGDRALREMAEILNNGGQVGFTPDGPKGPAQTVQAGVIWAAQKTGLPIVPTSVALRRRIVFNSWDKFKLPLPFGVVVLAHGKPFHLSPDMDSESAQKCVRAALNARQDLADQYLASAPGWWSSFAGELLFLLYNLLALFFSPLICLGLFFKFGFKRALKGLSERLGAHSLAMSSSSRLWFHAASIGEWRALKPIVRQYLLQNPQSDLVVTVTTPEAKTVVEREESRIQVRFLPIDIPWILNGWIQRLNPSGLFIIESELWPNLINSVHRHNIPVFILNGRLSEKSKRGWMKLRPLARRILDQLSLVLARTEKDKYRFQELGLAAEKVVVLGNTKADNLEVVTEEMKAEKKRGFFKAEDVLCLIGVSTWPGEEALILKAFHDNPGKNLRIMLAPRRQDRLEEVERLVESQGLSSQRYSDVKNGRQWSSPVLLIDTVGDLKDLFIVCDFAFVGGSVYPRGGQNPLEPGAARLPLIFGSHMHNFEDEASGFVKSGSAVLGHSGEEVSAKFNELIESEPLRKFMGEAVAREVIRQQGATRRTLDVLRKTMGI